MTETASPSVDGLDLACLHRRLDGRLGAVAGAEGVEAVAGYGRPDDERRALTEGAALIDLSHRGRLELVGEDRHRYLNGQVTCEVKELAVGHGAYGFVTSPQGKVEADVVVLALEDRLWLELPPGRGDAIAERLGKYVIADRVEVRPLTGTLQLAVLGPEAEARLAEVAEELPAGELEHRETTVLGTAVRLVRQRRAGRDGFTLWASAAEAEPLFEGLVARGAIEPAGVEALDAVRVAAGVPAFGADFGPDHFPQETGLEEQAVSYTKGCYLGQEVVARIHYRGQVNRAMRRLRFDAAEPPAPGTRLLAEGDEVGTVGSAVASPSGDGAVGLAILHRRGNEPGTRLEVEGGGTARVAELAG